MRVHNNNGSLFFHRVTVEHARGPRRGGGGGGGGGGGFRDEGRDRRSRWVEKYGAPRRTDYRIVVKNLSSKVSWQVGDFIIFQSVSKNA